MKTLRGSIACVSAFALVASPMTVAVAGTPSGLKDLVGARGSSGETQLQSRGWEATDKYQDAANGRYTYWWNGSKKKCVRVYTSDGRYAAIDEATNKDCGRNSNGTAIAVAVGAAALIGAIALATSGKDREDNRYQSAAYKRGYDDGYAGRRYDGSSQDYSDGYGAGSRARGGYGSNTGWQDLVGRSNDYADSELRSRGYVLAGKDDLSSGHERLYWERRSETCLSVRTEGGNVRSIDKVRKRACR